MKKRIIKARVKIIIILMIIGLSAGITVVMSEDTSTSRGIKMSHVYKADTMGMDCSLCHSADESNDRLISYPDHTNCEMCHSDALESQDPETGCGYCHDDPDYATSFRKNQVLSPLVDFSHVKHENAGVTCNDCHDPTIEPAKDELIPDMASCVTCHEAKKVGKEEDCAVCHFQGWEKTAPPSHDEEWPLAHGTNLTLDRKSFSCDSCHTSSLGNSCLKCHHTEPAAKNRDCSRCHFADNYDRQTPEDHTGFWKKNHGFSLTETTIDKNCSLCHTPHNNNDCFSCHSREKPSDHTIAFANKGHVKAAQVDRESCATCHTQSQCITCHTTNPPMSHTGFWGSPRNRHCLRCHMEGNDFGAGGIGDNCTTCHKTGRIYAEHTSEPYHDPGNCTNCHDLTSTGTAAIPHPYPDSDAACRSCH